MQHGSYGSNSNRPRGRNHNLMEGLTGDDIRALMALGSVRSDQHINNKTLNDRKFKIQSQKTRKYLSEESEHRVYGKHCT